MDTIFSLQPWRIEYSDSATQQANNINVARYLRDVFPNPYTLADAEWYINDCMANEGKKQICRAIVVNGKAVGSIGVFVKDDVYRYSGELGYWLGEEYWGKGIMTEATKQICAMAFSQFNIVRIFAEPFAVNIGSCRVLEKAGFTFEGTLHKSVVKKGKIMDSNIYALFSNSITLNESNICINNY